MGFLHPGPIAFLPSSSDRPQSKPRLSRMDDPELPGFNSTRGLVPHSRFHTPARNAREHTNCPAHASFQGPFKPLRCSLLSAHSILLGSFCAMPSGREAFTEQSRDFLTGAPEFLFALPLEAQPRFSAFCIYPPLRTPVRRVTLGMDWDTTVRQRHVYRLLSCTCVYIYHHTHAQLGASRVLPCRHFWVVSWLFQFQWI